MFLLQQSYPFTLLRFVQKRRELHQFLCVHIDLPDNKYGAKDIHFCAFTLLRFCEAQSWTLERFQKPPFLWISTFESVFKNLRFCGVFVQISVNAFTITEVFVSDFVHKRSSVNGALDFRFLSIGYLFVDNV